jgi:hypothetical protein
MSKERANRLAARLSLSIERVDRSVHASFNLVARKSRRDRLADKKRHDAGML